MATMISLNAVTKSYGAVKVLDPITLEIEEGSFTSLLGASGCGKTTLLNLIAGLDQPTGGTIAIGGGAVFDPSAGVDLAAERRNIGYVFQSYALWPHMRVVDNVAYPLKVRGINRAERRAAATEMLKRLELGDLGERYPFELSGGQQQRVAIARALAYRPQVLLLDEPLSNLDVQLRERARAWLAQLQADLELTTVLVTHDHVEALSLSDRVVLLRNGRIEQDGAPEAIYDSPSSAYAADFVGGANVFDAVVEGIAEGPANTALVTLVLGPTGGGRIQLTAAHPPPLGSAVRAAVRPRSVTIVDAAPAHQTGVLSLPLEIGARLFRGGEWEILGTTPIGDIRVVGPRPPVSTPTFAVVRHEDFRLLLS